MPTCTNCKVKKPVSKFKLSGEILPVCVDCRTEASDSDSESDSSDNEIYCDACDKSFLDVKKALAHSKTKAHISKWNKKVNQ